MDMINKKNMGYEGEFWFGNPPQRMQVIFDTGSAWVWLFSETCAKDKCPKNNKKYELSKSNTFKPEKQEEKKLTLTYGKGAVQGLASRDQVCFDSKGSKCVDNMIFITVDRAMETGSL
jgi:hypothetical protein